MQKSIIDNFTKSTAKSGVNSQGGVLGSINSDSHKFVPLRPIHYLGSKLRMVEKIQNVIDKLDPDKGLVCDLFSGSGTVAHFLSRSRPVVAVDIQEYSRAICSALLSPPNNSIKNNFTHLLPKDNEFFTQLSWAISPLITHETACFEAADAGNVFPLCDLIENGSIVGYEQGFDSNCSLALSKNLREVVKRLKKLNLINSSGAVITRHYGGLYFSYLQSVQIDVLLEHIKRAKPELRDTMLAALLSTASDSVNTVGNQFAQPIRPRNSSGEPKPNIRKRISRGRSVDIFSSFFGWLNVYLELPKPKFNNSTLKTDYLEALDKISEKISVIYADPPYTRDHYSRFYHVLETISLGDIPELSKITVGKRSALTRGIYREGRHQSAFCIKSKAPKAFEDLFAKASSLKSSLVLSYSPYDNTKKSHPRLITISELKELASRYYGSVEVVSVGTFSHSKLNRTENNFDINYDAEQLIVCKL